jgi:predicted fused transcriptional regulator/phosphomethylpyrimidine kinase
VRGRARVFLEPEFGASSHMAKVLLAAMKIDGRIRAAINTRYNDAVDGVIKRLGYSVPQFDRIGLPEREARGESSTISRIKKALEECGKAAEAVIDRGGYGTEPVVYLFGGSAVEAARRAIEVAEEVAKAQQDK